MELDQRLKIIEASKNLFYETGYANTTIRQISDALEISNSLLFHYFKNKKEILTQVFREHNKKVSHIVETFSGEFSLLECQALILKIYLIPLLTDKKLSSLYLETFYENVMLNDIISDSVDTYFPFKERENNLSVFRLNSFIGTIRENVISLLKGEIEFTESNIDLYIVSTLNLFFSIPRNEVKSALAKIDPVLKSISFNGFEINILKDELPEFLNAEKIGSVFDQNKVVSIRQIIFSGETPDPRLKIFNKALILTKNYKLKHPMDFRGFQEYGEDFINHLSQLTLQLVRRFRDQFLVTAFMDKDKNGIHSLEAYGIDAVQTMNDLNMNLGNDYNTITHCAFIFYS